MLHQFMLEAAEAGSLRSQFHRLVLFQYFVDGGFYFGQRGAILGKGIDEEFAEALGHLRERVAP